MKYFWNHAYRHYMRSLKPSLQKDVYDTFLEFDLELNGVSDLHEQLICEIIGDYTIDGEPAEAREERLRVAYSQCCANCGTVLGLDCGEAEPDYDEDFCSEGCYNEMINNLK